MIDSSVFQISANERLLAAGGQELLRGSLSFSPIQVFTRDTWKVDLRFWMTPSTFPASSCSRWQNGIDHPRERLQQYENFLYAIVVVYSLSGECR
jgi:hypothetical protein